MNFDQIAHTHRSLSPSTNSELINFIKNNDLPPNLPHLMTADQQSAGRGQHNRSWVSPVGNVYLSLYVPMQSQHPQGLHRLTGGLSLCVGLSLYQLPIIQKINHYRQKNNLPLIQVKWANDLGLYHHTTHLFNKLAGILIEPVFNHKTMLGIVIGVGMNIANNPIIKDGLHQAISIQSLIDELGDIDDELFDNINPQSFYLPMCQCLINAITTHNQYTINEKYGIVFDNQFITNFNNANALTNQPIGIFEQDDMTTPNHSGICVGIDTDGTLLLKNHQGNIDKIFAGMAKVLF